MIRKRKSLRTSKAFQADKKNSGTLSGRTSGTHSGTTSGAFVPAQQNNSRPHRSNSFSFQHKADSQNVALGSFDEYSRNKTTYSKLRKSGMRLRTKVALALVIVVLATGVSALGFYVFKESQKAAINADLHNMSVETLEAIDSELTGMTKFDEPFTLLLLGSDARSGDPGLGARADTIILCRIDPTTNVVSMVSIPRDTKVDIPGTGTEKFNATYAFGGPSTTIAAVKELCDVDIDHYAEIDFDGLVSLVDAIGGIDVYVEETIDDPDAGDIVIPAGQQHLDGASTLVFSRSRAYANGDFTRIANQRKIIEAIVHKGLETPARDLYGLIQASTSFLTTDSAMDVDFIFSLADQIRHNNDYPITIYSATIPSSPETIDGISYVIPDEEALAKMMKTFLEGGDITPKEDKKAAAAQNQTQNDVSQSTEVIDNSGASGTSDASGAAY